MANGDEQNLNYQRETVRILREQTDALKQQQRVAQQTSEQNKAQLDASKALARSAAQQANQTSEVFNNINSTLEITKALEKAEKARDALANEFKSSSAAVREILLDQVQSSEDLVDSLQKQQDKSKKIDESLGLSGKALGVINKFLGNNNSLTKEILTNTRKKLAKEKESIDKVKGFTTLLSEAGETLAQNLVDPLVFIESLIAANNSVANIGRNLGVSAFEASKLRNQLVGVRIEAQDIRVTTETLIEAQNTLNSAFGTAALFNGEIAVGAARALDSQLISAEAVSQLAGDAARLGISFEEALIRQEESVNQINAQTGASISLKEVLDASNRVTGQIRAQLGSNPEEIARAVTQAKALGFELEQIAAAGKQILDFESSIANELEAELLTGKQLNLERARLAALTGDLETLTNEISANVGDFNDFTSLNVIQQEAIASAVGMTADELANSLVTEENRAQLLQDAIAANNTQSVQALQQLSAQEAFAKSVEQVKGLFTDIVGTLSPILTLIGKIAEFTATLPGQFALAGAAIGKFIIPRLAISAALAGVLSPLRLAAGLGAIGGIIALTRSRPGNDVAMSNNMLVTKNAGTIKLNNDDTVIAGTDLGGGIDYDKMAMAMSKAQVNVTTKYNSFRAYSTTSNGGRYQSSARYESKFA